MLIPPAAFVILTLQHRGNQKRNNLPANKKFAQKKKKDKEGDKGPLINDKLPQLIPQSKPQAILPID